MKSLPDARAWTALCARLQRAVPYGLATALEVDWEEGLVRRRHSSDEHHYPSGGVKRLMSTKWAKQVLESGRVFRARGSDEMKDAFEDHPLLSRLGLEHALNVPIWADGRVEWSLNLLRAQPAFSDADVEAVEKALQQEDEKR